MAYHVYTTKGLVLYGGAQGETDKYFSIFTEELGLVFVLGKGIRKSESKLKSHTDDLTLGEFSFVRGKKGFRLIGARGVEQIWKAFKNEPTKRKVLITVLQTLVMLLAGEEPNKELFTIFTNALAFLQETQLTHSEINAWKGVTLLRILSILGYGNFAAYESLIATPLWTLPIIADAVILQSHIDRDIEEAMQASDLRTHERFS